MSAFFIGEAIRHLAKEFATGTQNLTGALNHMASALDHIAGALRKDNAPAPALPDTTMDEFNISRGDLVWLLYTASKILLTGPARRKDTDRCVRIFLEYSPLLPSSLRGELAESLKDCVSHEKLSPSEYEKWAKLIDTLDDLDAL